MRGGGPGDDERSDDDGADGRAPGQAGAPRPAGTGASDGTGDAEFERALDALARWAGAARVDDAVRRRRRTAWLARQAEDETTLAAVLAGLAERGRTVTVGSTDGRRHQGRVWLVGRDVVGMAAEHGRSWLALDSLAWVRTRSGAAIVVAPGPDGVARSSAPEAAGAAAGGVEAAGGSGLATLAGELAELAHDRSRVVIHCRHGDQVLSGVLISVGRDVATLRDDGDGLIYVALASVAEVSLPESG